MRSGLGHLPKGQDISSDTGVRSYRDATLPLFRSFLRDMHQIFVFECKKKGGFHFHFFPRQLKIFWLGIAVVVVYRDLLASPGRSSLLIQSFFSTAMSGHCAHSCPSRGLCFFSPLVRHNSPQAFSAGRAPGRAGCAFAAHVSLDTPEQDARIIRMIDEYTKAEGKYHLPTRDEKKVCIFSAGHRGRRWHGEVTAGAYCTVYNHSTKFFSYKVLI